MRRARVVLIDDEPGYRGAVAQQLRNSGFEVFAGADVTTVLERVNCQGASCLEMGDTALVELSLGGADRHRNISLLRQHSAPLAIAALTAHCTDDAVFGALAAGADGYLLKSEPIDSIPGYVRKLRDGASPLSPVIATRLVRHFQTRIIEPIDQPLSPRELQLLRLLGRGLSFSNSAAELRVGLETVKTMVKRIRSKLNAKSVPEAISVSFRAGILH